MSNSRELMVLLGGPSLVKSRLAVVNPWPAPRVANSNFIPHVKIFSPFIRLIRDSHRTLF